MARRLLLPLDGSDLGGDVADYIAPLLVTPSEVQLLHLFGPHDPRPGPTNRAAPSLAEVARRLEEAGARLSIEVRESREDPAVEILEAIRSLTPWLVALSSHGQSGRLRWLRGSVADKVLRDSPQPVLLLGPHSLGRARPRFRRILVPLDPLAANPAALDDLVCEVAGRHGCGVLLGVTEPAVRGAPLDGQSRALELTARLEREGVLAVTMLIEGPAASGILDVAQGQDCDLLALGRHPERWSAWAVTDKVLRHSDRSLLVI